MDKQLSIYIRFLNPFFSAGKFKLISFSKYDIGGINIRLFVVSISVNYD